MTPKQFVAILRAFIRRRPFSPFVVQLDSGDDLVVSHPETLSVFGRIAYHVGPRRDVHFFNVAKVCQLFNPPTASPA